MRQLTSKRKLKRRTRGLTKIRKTEIARVIRGLKDANQPMRGVTVNPATGEFTILLGHPGELSAPNSFDEILKAKVLG